jgi:hypothetical protein
MGRVYCKHDVVGGCSVCDPEPARAAADYPVPVCTCVGTVLCAMCIAAADCRCGLALCDRCVVAHVVRSERITAERLAKYVPLALDAFERYCETNVSGDAVPLYNAVLAWLYRQPPQERAATAEYMANYEPWAEIVHNAGWALYTHTTAYRLPNTNPEAAN